MAQRGMAMSATTKANIGAGRKAGLRLNSKGLGTSPFSQAKSAASKSVRKVNSEVKSKIAKAKKRGIAGKPSSPKVNKKNLDPTPSPDSFRISKAKALLENTMRAKNRVNRRLINSSSPVKLIEFNKSEESKNNKVKGSVQLIGGLGLTQQGIRSGLPRTLGIRLESHSTSRKAAKEILKNKGILDPNKGGTGASRLDDSWAKDAKGRVYITGKHPEGLDQKIKQDTPRVLDNPIFDRFQSKVQRASYRGQGGKSTLGLLDIISGGTGIKGRSLYLGGGDSFYKQKFIPAPDDYAMISNSPIQVYGNRFKATLAGLQEEGGGNAIKGARKLMAANKGRVGAGLALLGTGVGTGSYLVSKGIQELNPDNKVKAHTRKVGNRIINIKSFIRNLRNGKKA